MKRHVPFLLSLLSVMGLLAWTATVRAQCLTEKVTLDLPITGGSATDLSDYFHTVTLQGSPTYVNGQDGSAMGALNFSTQTQYATVDADPAFELMDDAFTISAWVYPVSFNSYNAVVTKLNGSHRDLIFRYHNDGKFQVHFTNSSNGITSVTTDGAVVSINQWTHLAVTWDGTDMKLFVNGALEKQMTLSESPDFQSAGSVRIGTLNGGSERVAGYVDNVQLRAFATPDDEVSCLMNDASSIDQGIVLDLPMNNSADDVSANDNDGSLVTVGAAANRWGESQQALNFIGSGYAFVDNISAYGDLSNAFTVSAWIKPSTVSGNKVIVSKSGNGRDIVLRIDNGKLTAHYYVTGYVWCTPATATVSPNEWSHVACTWDGTTMAIYHNGIMLASIEPTSLPSFTSNDWTIGSLTTSGSEYFTGAMDEFKVWNRALTICELRSDIYPNTDLLVDDNLQLCPGQNQVVEPIGGLCSVVWTNDNSTEFFYDIVADDLGVGDHQIVLEAYDHYDHFYSDTVNVTVSLCTGMDEASEVNDVTLMPNPASNVITVSGSDLAEIQLMDVSGRTVRQVAVPGSKTLRMDISELPTGIYLVSAKRNDGTVHVERLIKP